MVAQILLPYDRLEKFGCCDKIEVFIALIFWIGWVEAVALVVWVAHNGCEPVAANTAEE